MPPFTGKIMSKKVLSPSDVIVARKTVKLNGRTYQAGDVITDSTVDFRTKDKLHRVGIVVSKDMYEAKYGETQEAAEEEVVAPEATIVAEVVEEEVSTEEVPAVEATEEVVVPVVEEVKPAKATIKLGKR